MCAASLAILQAASGARRGVKNKSLQAEDYYGRFWNGSGTG